MKNFFTLTLCFLTLSLTAQIDCPNTYDGDGDGAIGISDLLGLLALFGDADMDSDGVWDSEDDCIDEAACNYQSNPTEPCDALDAIGVCGGNCLADDDGDGICDLTPITNDNIHAAVDLWLASISQAVATYGHISEWDVSSVTDMYNLFSNSSFNGDISSWDVSSVTNMSSMFYQAHSFNGDISSWDVSSVTNMSYVFSSNSNFNGDISSWDVSSVTNMYGMFKHAENFNNDISSWDVSSVIYMSWMFKQAYSFNGDLSAWDVSSVTDINEMFNEAHSFNGVDISSWDVSSAMHMHRMFKDAINFNSDISSWDVSSVTSMVGMFDSAANFNSNISSWDVSSVSNFDGMFDSTSALSEENKCAIHTSFSLNTNWPYDWYGNCPFVCGDLVSHQGYDYSTVLIGEQCWYSDNCRYLPSVTPADFSSDTTPYYYVYSYDGYDVEAAMSTDNYGTYGVLYNWPAVMTEGICPTSWHIPSDEEFTQLTDHLGGESVAGGKMKEVGFDHWLEPNLGATNFSSFNGLPAGSYEDNGNFGNLYMNAFWWSSTSTNTGYSYIRLLGFNYENVNRVVYPINQGFSARCIKD